MSDGPRLGARTFTRHLSPASLPASIVASRAFMRIQRALISVSDKAGIVDFARELQRQGIEILSTGGTASALQSEGVPTTEVSQFTGSPEILEGRVKTLHPKIHGGLLYVRGDEEHEKQADEHGIVPIDLVVVNLYPFEATIAREDVTLAEAIEQIDIGGPSLIRSAAKNYQSVTVVTDPADYGAVLQDMSKGGGSTSRALRERLAIKAFNVTGAYDRAVAGFLNRKQETPLSGWIFHWSFASATAKTLTSTPNSMVTSALTSRNCRARNSRTITSSILVRPRN
jgi:AICAR transformylase/IMP cyclohydrolase PurH